MHNESAITKDEFVAAIPLPSKPREPMPESERERVKYAVLKIASGAGLRPVAAVMAMVDACPDVYARGEGAHHAWICDRRGLMLIGPPGTGKTMALALMARTWGMPVLSAQRMASMFASQGETAFWEYVETMSGREVVLDDLGAERELASYGNSGPISDWICRRYEVWQVSDGPAMHISSNSSAAQLTARYGARVLDRLMECMVVRPISGASMRSA